MQQIWPGLRTVEYELSIVKFLQQHVKEGERCQAANRAALIHLEAQVINIACDDPGRAVGAIVLLPMLRERIESQAYAHYNKDVLLAEQKVCPTTHLSASAHVVCQVFAWAAPCNTWLLIKWTLKSAVSSRKEIFFSITWSPAVVCLTDFTEHCSCYLSLATARCETEAQRENSYHLH